MKYKSFSGLEAYLNGYDKKILANKLVLGVPWYGYIYQCISLVGVSPIFLLFDAKLCVLKFQS